jgi:hypothetical protein
MKPVKNTEQVIAKATERVSADMNSLASRRDGALSAFRRARAELQAVNAETQKGLDRLSALKSFIENEVASGEKMISDNAHVCAKITEIIGE